MTEKKIFKVHCAKCKKPFYMDYQIAEPNADGKADVWVECTYCNEKMMINIPRKYIAPSTPIYRGD